MIRPDGKLLDGMIVVAGLPRSGTTWLGKIFDSHPDTFYSHEPDSDRPFRDVPMLVTRRAAASVRETIEREVLELANVRSLRVVGKMPLFDKRHQTLLPVRIRSMGLLAFKSAARFLPLRAVPKWLSGDRARAPRWVWKSIESSGRLGAIARTFPEARTIFILRHPCGFVASVLRGEAGRRFSAGAASEDYGVYRLLLETDGARERGLTLDMLEQMKPVERLAWRWALFNEFALESLEGLENNRVLRYEDLCAEPVAGARGLMAFAGLEWSQQTQAFVEESTSRDKGGYYGVFKDPLAAAEKWRTEMRRTAIDEVLAVVAGTRGGDLYDL